jgi:uncharacterized protein YkwD
MTIGFLLLVTIFGGVWTYRNSTDSVYSISKPSPVEVDDAIPPGSGLGDNSPSATPSPSASPKPSPSPTKIAVKARPVPVTKAPAPKPRTTTPAPLSPDLAAEREVVRLVNAERAKAGCGALRQDTRLDTAARGHSADMARRNYFSHTTPDGVDPWERARAAGYNTPTGENIAMGQRTAAEVTKAWMNSSGHRANILNCDSKAIGMGLARNSGGTTYWTQMFGSV